MRSSGGSPCCSDTPKHLLLGELIDEAEHEYGFAQQGTICHRHLWPRRHGEGGCGDAKVREISGDVSLR